MYEKQAVYEQKIDPLMRYLHKICEEEGIDMIAEFILKKDDSGKYVASFRNGNGNHHIVTTKFMLGK